MKHTPDTQSSKGTRRKHSRYHPETPMTKVELKAWRKEERRVRNRKSAAACRQRIRDRIFDLESQLQLLQSKYSAAMSVVVRLEAEREVIDDTGFPDHASSHTTTSIWKHKPPIRLSLSESSDPGSSISLSPLDKRSSAQVLHEFEVEKKYQHIMNMIRRPIAVEISGADTSSTSSTPVNIEDTTSSEDDVMEEALCLPDEKLGALMETGILSVCQGHDESSPVAPAFLELDSLKTEASEEDFSSPPSTSASSPCVEEAVEPSHEYLANDDWDFSATDHDLESMLLGTI